MPRCCTDECIFTLQGQIHIQHRGDNSSLGDLHMDLKAYHTATHIFTDHTAHTGSITLPSINTYLFTANVDLDPLLGLWVVNCTLCTG